MSPYFLVAASIILTVTSQLLFKYGVNSLGPIEFSFAHAINLFSKIFRNIPIFIGMVTFGLSFIIWIFALSKLKLSIAYPLTSINFILIGILSAVILHEPISAYQIGGIVFIAAGILLLFR